MFHHCNDPIRLGHFEHLELPRCCIVTWHLLATNSKLRRISSLRRIWQFNEHRPRWSFKQRKLNQAITITLRLTEPANIFLNTYPVVVFSDLSLQPFLPCTRCHQCFTTATIPSRSAILNILNCHVVVL